MQINRRITNGLAWAGLFVVVAVPVADAISGQLMGSQDQMALASVDMVSAVDAPVPAPLSQRPDELVAEQTPVAPVQPPVVTKPATSNPVVDNYVSSGKKLPSYITDGDTQAATPAPVVTAPMIAAAPAVTKPVVAAPAPVAVVADTPAPPVSPTPAVDPVTVATLSPAKIAPMPMPLSMRPAPMVRPLASPVPGEEIVLPPEVVARNDAPVVDDLQDWESGPLSDFLARRQQPRSSAQVYDSNGFFLSDGPDGRQERDIYVGPADDEVYFPFGN